jgi:MFS transporter, DHA3 family, macrolide efflux protein
MAHPFRSILKDQRIAALWGGLAFNGFGGQLSGIALVWLAIEVAGPTASYVSTAQLAMSLVASLGASAFVDRFAPRTMMIAADLLSSMVLIVTVAIISIFGPSLWVLIATSMALAALGAVFQPTLLASVPLIAVTKKRIQGTNALLDATARLSRLLGPFLAGPLSTVIPLLHFLTINAATFALSAAGIFAVGKALASPVPQQASSSVWEKITRGYHVALSDQRIAQTLTANTAVLALWFIAVGLGFPFLAAGTEIKGLWFTGIGALAALAGAYGAGDFVSNVWVAGVHPTRPERFMFIGYIILGAGLVAVPVFLWVLPSAAALLFMMLACFCAGTGGPMFFIPMMTFFQTDLPQAELGGLLRFRFALSATAMMVGSAIAPMLFGGIGPAATILLAGGVIVLIGGWGFFFSPKLGLPSSAA